ncbi:bifunctional tetrahydrofolate synthase/dihydrofolate synthase [Psychrosphaera haliotis]|uniref:Dihydrofolate synthase/folylpolyglutamate synthase n=1 Tax=Psychrosphaera haliotis TaxID=555083 RepID=A0A6N8F649_9GAMM|nr:bifunctional tetrahydrofolate synthase/dihydrofolate synthase [Psychrosphaera haliotis]MUH72116.1 bifunctional tetrahydrofolate synthase/dihydrofolate synthase [Psychrosphaera haliotis]
MSNEIFQSQSLNDWLFYLEQQHPTEIELGLSRIQSVADKAKLNHLNAGKTVLVAGTNGKGTTIRFIELALIELGYSVGVFSSPHLFTYNERVRVNGELLADSDHISAFDFVEQHKGNTSLTYFEFSTLAAFKLFQQHKLDFVLVEVGLGGRLDSTNILQQDISVITSIGLDHIDWLGNTLEKIAFEKAGIFKANNTAIIGEQSPPLTIEQQAANLKVKTTLWSGRDFTFSSVLECPKTWQFKSGQVVFEQLNSNFVPRQNIATAIQTLIELNIELTEGLLNKVIKNFSLPGRMQILCSKPLQMVDVAHNPHAIAYLSDTLASNDAFKHINGIHAVVAMMKDKDIKETLAIMVKSVSHWHIGELEANPRAAKAESIQAVLEDLGAKNVSVYSSVGSAWAQAKLEQQEEELLLGFGSFYTVCDILKNNNKEKRSL